MESYQSNRYDIIQKSTNNKNSDESETGSSGTLIMVTALNVLSHLSQKLVWRGTEMLSAL